MNNRPDFPPFGPSQCARARASVGIENFGAGGSRLEETAIDVDQTELKFAPVGAVDPVSRVTDIYRAYILSERICAEIPSDKGVARLIYSGKPLVQRDSFSVGFDRA